MDINFTFFIQAFHFLIAYFILEKLLFKPTITTIEQEQKQYNDLITTINTQEKLLADKEELKQHQWNTAKLLFAKIVPQIKVTEKPIITTGTVKPEIIMSSQEQQEYQQTLQKTLLKRLSHVS